MLKNIWIQLVNRRSKNIWLALELLLIFCLIWYIVDYFFVLGYNESLTSHRDIEETYYIQLGVLSDTHADFSTEENTPQASIDNLLRVVERLREHPDVETVALANSNVSLPSLGGFFGSEFRNAEDTNKVANVQRVMFDPKEDYLKTFRYTAGQGTKTASVADYDWSDPGAVLISQMVADQLFPGGQAIGKTIENTYLSPENPRETCRVIGVVDNIKEYSYTRPICTVYFPSPLNEQTYRDMRIAIRTKENVSGVLFASNFKKEMSSRLKIGNYYLMGVTPFSQMAKDTNYRYGITNEIRLRVGLMLFFLVSITLCVLGTFWYRVAARREEIGVRRALGADIGSIRRLFVWEGLLLLSLILLPAMLVEIPLIHAGLLDTIGQSTYSYGSYLPDHAVLRFLITNVITWLLMALIIIVAITYPGWLAGRIHPVDALRDE